MKAQRNTQLFQLILWKMGLKDQKRGSSWEKLYKLFGQEEKATLDWCYKLVSSLNNDFREMNYSFIECDTIFRIELLKTNYSCP